MRKITITCDKCGAVATDCLTIQENEHGSYRAADVCYACAQPFIDLFDKTFPKYVDPSHCAVLD